MDFRYMQTDHAHISKRTLKEKKNLPWQLKAWKIIIIKKEVSKDR